MGSKLSRQRFRKRASKRTKHLFPFLDVDVNIEQDDRCSHSGIVCLKGGKIAVVDYLGRAVKCYDTKLLKLHGYYEFTSPPYEICSASQTADEDDVFVTLPFDHKIVHLKIDEHIHFVKEISTEGMCYGIAGYKSGLAVSLRIDKTIWQIEIIDFMGSVLKVFKDDDNGIELFGFPDYLNADPDGDRLYVSDGLKNAVICLNLKTATMISAKEIYSYTDRHLRIPKGVTLDVEGNAFVVGCESNNVHKISKNGAKLGIVLGHHESLTNPMGIAYDCVEQKVFITEGSRKVMIFKDVK